MTSKDKVVEVAAALVFRAGKLLITQRMPGTHLEGLWEFPGGKREINESFEECLRRELREELAVDACVREAVEDVTHDYGSKQVRLRFFLCDCGSGEPAPVGCAALKWISRDQLLEHDFAPADQNLICRLVAEDQFWR